MDKVEKKKRTTEGIRVAFILRHNPEKYGLTITPEGWVSTAGLKLACGYTDAYLDELVAYDDKRRYEYNADKTLIRALQGHSHKDVKVTYIPVKPPQWLYHGTTRQALAKIEQEGLSKMERHHVHMHALEARAIMAALRRKDQEPVLVRVEAAAMHACGFVFYRTDNDVWLTDHVLPIHLHSYWPHHADSRPSLAKRIPT